MDVRLGRAQHTRRVHACMRPGCLAALVRVDGEEGAPARRAWQGAASAHHYVLTKFPLAHKHHPQPPTSPPQPRTWCESAKKTPSEARAGRPASAASGVLGALALAAAAASSRLYVRMSYSTVKLPGAGEGGRGRGR